MVVQSLKSLFFSAAAAVLLMHADLPAAAALAVNHGSNSERSVILTVSADSLVVEKGERELHLYSGGAVVQTFGIALGFNPLGPKRMQGDGRTPEGLYTITGKNPESSYHLSLKLSYPNQNDRARAKKMGVNPGGDIFIHGWPNRVSKGNASPPRGDWTLGCIAVTDEEIEELWRWVSPGTPVIIYP